MKAADDAEALARTMVAIGHDHGVNTAALVTRMDSVLGRTAGNALEVQEALDTLEGHGPATVVELTLELAREMLSQAGLDADPAKVLASGDARNTFEAMVAAQGGDLGAGLPRASRREIVAAPADGYVTSLEAHAVGMAAWRLGAGRARKEDAVNPAAGVVCLVEPGDRVTEGDPVFELHFDEPHNAELVRGALVEAIELNPEPIQPPPLVIDTIRSG